MEFKQYPSYKNSGVEWLGDVPEHWEVVRLDGAYKIVRGNTGFSKADLLETGQYVALQYGKTYKVDEINNSFTSYVNQEFFKVTQIAEFEDIILISTSETLEDLGHSCFYARQDIGLVGGEQFLLKPNQKDALGKYLYYSTKVFSRYLHKYATGTKVYRFNIDDLKTIYIPKLSSFDQQKIVSFLDTETARIDNLISKQQKLIKLLEEQRKSIISHAVTKGLNPNALMKDSGVEWLGEVPESWDEKKVKFVCKLITDKTANKTNVIALENIESWTANFISSDSEFDSDAILFEKNDVLFGKLRPYLAKVYLTKNTGEAIGDIYVLRPNKLIAPQFLKFFMLSEKFIDYVNSSTNGTKMPRANWDFIGSVSIWLPEISIQGQIVEYLDSALLKIELIINKQKTLIEKLKEYRSSIISHAVTGKIDVREWVA